MSDRSTPHPSHPRAPDLEGGPVAVAAAEVPPRTGSLFPEPFASRLAGRERRALGDVFGLTNFGVQLTRLPPGCSSGLRHAHSHQDELVYVLEGEPVLRTNAGERRLGPGDCAGFRAGTGDAHHLHNDTGRDVVYLEIGDRTPDDDTTYPDDDVRAVYEGGRWRFTHKDGTPFR